MAASSEKRGGQGGGWRRGEGRDVDTAIMSVFAGFPLDN